MKKTIANLAGKAVILLFCGYLFAGAWMNRKITGPQWESYRSRQIDFAAFAEKVSSDFQSKIEGKDAYVNLNGLYARLTGHAVANEVARMKNGMLTTKSYVKIDIKPRAEKAAELKRYLEEENIDFLYVQAPHKTDLGKELLPAGIVNYANETADDFLDCLREAGVETLDLRPDTSATPEMVETYFYRTDHHWNPEGAFVGFQKIMEYMREKYPETDLEECFWDRSFWESHRKPKWLLGSYGMRVGIFFGGVDDLIWLTPKPDTEISCALPYSDEFRKGNFEEANIWEKYYTGKKPDYFHSFPYSVYVNGDRPLVQHRSEKAPSDRKLLILKDSFTLPVQAYLSTEFQQVDVIDLRHYTKWNFWDHVKEFEPDMVLMMLNPSSLDNDQFFFYDFAEAKDWENASYQALDKNGKALLDGGTLSGEEGLSIELDESRLQDGGCEMIRGLESGATYRLTFDKAFLPQGEDGCLKLALCDGKDGKVLDTRLFDTAFYNHNNGYRWIFTVPEEAVKARLLLYPEFGQDNENRKEAQDNKERRSGNAALSGFKIETCIFPN